MSKQRKIIKFISFALLSVWGYYLAVYDAFEYQSYNQVIGTLLVCSPFIFSYFSEESINRKSFFYNRLWLKKLAMILCIILTIFFVEKQQKRYLHQELAEYGVEITAKVVGFKIKHRKTKRKYLIFDYSFAGKRWRQEVSYADNPPYELHQTFCIHISQRRPEMFLLCER